MAERNSNPVWLSCFVHPCGQLAARWSWEASNSSCSLRKEIPRLHWRVVWWCSNMWVFWVVRVVKNLPANAGDVRDAGLISCQCRRHKRLAELACQCRGQRAWEDPLEEGMETHSSILAWRIPWTESGGLWSIGLQRVRHNWSNLASTHTAVCGMLRTKTGWPGPFSGTAKADRPESCRSHLGNFSHYLFGSFCFKLDPYL